jgi:hypothetical protein
MSFTSYRNPPSIFSQPTWGMEFRSTLNQTVALATDFRSPDISMWKCEAGFVCNRFIFASPHFELAATNNVVFDRAAALKAILDGAMYLFSPAHEPFTFGRLINNRTGKSYECWEGNVLSNPFDDLVLSMGVPRVYAPGNSLSVEQMIFLSRFDDVTRDLLKHLGYNGPDYRTLYSVLDWLKTHGWSDERIAGCSGMNSGDVKRFTGTVNNVETLGVFARHGAKRHGPPQKTITLAEAQKLILKATYQFVVERAIQADIVAKWEAIRCD